LEQRIHILLKRAKGSVGFALVLHCLVPGLGHIFRRHYVFGLFIFLLMLLAVALFFIHFLLSIPTWVSIVLFSLPAVFYALSFVDLVRLVRSQGQTSSRGTFAAALFLTLAIGYQALSPTAPMNFLVRNSPRFDLISDSSLAPLFHKGDLVVWNRMAYRASLFFLDRSVPYRLPECGDVIGFIDEMSIRRTGVMVGYPHDAVEIADGLLIINGFPANDVLPAGIRLSGDMTLTRAGPTSILVATLSLGAVDRFHEVPVEGIVARVYRLF